MIIWKNAVHLSNIIAISFIEDYIRYSTDINLQLFFSQLAKSFGHQPNAFIANAAEEINLEK